jgi:hypothetical protein
MREIVNSLMAAVTCRIIQNRHADRYLGSIPRIEASDDLGGAPAPHVRCLGQTLTYVITEQKATERYCLKFALDTRQEVRTLKLGGKCTIRGLCSYHLLSKYFSFVFIDKSKSLDTDSGYLILCLPEFGVVQLAGFARFQSYTTILLPQGCRRAECASLNKTSSPTFSLFHIDPVSTAHQLQSYLRFSDLVESCVCYSLTTMAISA